MVERPSMRVLHAPTLGWRDVDLRDMLAKATGLPVEIENSGRVCALAQLWAMHGAATVPAGDFVFVSASDGLGVGVSFQREVLRGRHNLAGEFGHLLLSMDGPRCSCGSNGCWEAYVSNRATLARYFGQSPDAAGGFAGVRLHDRRSAGARARHRSEGARGRSRRPAAISASGSRWSSMPSIRPPCTSAARSPGPGTSLNLRCARRFSSAR